MMSPRSGRLWWSIALVAVFVLLVSCASTNPTRITNNDTANPAESDPETVAFEQAKKKNNVKAYTHFLSQNPDSKWKQEAIALRESKRLGRFRQAELRNDLFSAISQGNVLRVEQLLDLGVWVNPPDKLTKKFHYLPVLHQAVMHGDLDIIELLYQYGADLDAQDKIGDNALHLSAFEQRPDIVDWLKAKGARTDTFNDLNLQYWELESAKDVERLILKAALSIDPVTGQWKDEDDTIGQRLYFPALKRQPDNLVLYVIIRTVNFRENLLRQTLLLSAKLGFPGTMLKLNDLLMKNSSRVTAENF